MAKSAVGPQPRSGPFDEQVDLGPLSLEGREGGEQDSPPRVPLDPRAGGRPLPEARYDRAQPRERGPDQRERTAASAFDDDDPGRHGE